MSVIFPATGICAGGFSDNTVEFAAVAAAAKDVNLALADTALSMGTAAAAAAALALEFQKLQLQVIKSNRGAAVGVKSLTAGNSVAVNQAVLQRRNALAGPDNQFPIPPTPPGI